MANQGSDFGGSQAIAPALDGAPSRALTTVQPIGPGSRVTEFAPRGPEILVGGFNQTWLVNCLRRRWLLASLMGLLIGSAVGGLLMWLFPESSRVTAVLEVRSDEDASPLADRSRAVNPVVQAREAATHPAIMKAPFVLQSALMRADIANLDAVQYHKGEEMLWLLNNLKVNFAPDSSILQVDYEGDEPAEDMVKLIDAVVQAYKDEFLKKDRESKDATQGDLKLALTANQAALKAKLEKLKDMSEVNDYVGFQTVEYPKLRAEMGLFQTQLSDVEKQIAEIDVLKNLAILAARSPAPLEAAVQQAIDKDPSMASYKDQLFELSSQIQALASSTNNRNNSQLKRLQAAHSQTSAAMGQYRDQAEKEARDQLAKIPNESLRSALVEHRIRSEYLLGKQKELTDRLKAIDDRIKEMSVGDPEVQMLMQDIEGREGLVASLEEKVGLYEAQKTAESQNPARASDYEKVHVIQNAVATEKINVYERWAIAGIGGLGALALTCYGVALLEFRHRRLNSAEDLDEGLGVRVLGVLPCTSLKALAGNSLIATQVAEAIDNVRATIMHDSTSRPRQVVMVTSPATMEGCTTVAASLALSLARAGRRTLLVDGDLRSPSLHKLFGMPLEDGLSEVLRAEIDLADAVHPTTSEGLHLLTAGVCDMDAIHALATDQPQAIFDKLRDQFDFVVIDAPPVLGISDSLSLGQYVDGAVLTVLRDHSEIRKIHQAIETLRSMGVRLIGSVVNGVPVKADRRVVRLHQASAQRTPRLPVSAPEA